MEKRQGNFSVIMSVYAGDKAEYLDTALKSIQQNTLPPAEIVLVVDGPVGDSIKAVIKNTKAKALEMLDALPWITHVMN